MELTLVVPCFEEEGNIEALVREARAALAGVEHEIVAVDDGSRDGTWALLQRLAAENPELRPLRHERNRGMGAAVRTGIAQARGEFVLVAPGDNQFPLDQAPALLAAARAADVVVGERESAYATAGRSLPSWLYSAGMRVLFGLRMRGEVNLYRRAVVKNIGATSDGFFGNTELLIRALRAGARAVRVPVRFRERAAGRATGRDPRRILQVFRETARFFVRLQLERFRR
jgi:glycosyltransferase involved in cell wall biosynthesis